MIRKYDNRVILLSKSFATPIPERMSGIALGHFDSLEIIELPNNNYGLLENISKHALSLSRNTAGDRGVCPVYITTSDTGAAAFWNKKTTFCVVSFIHQPSNLPENEAYFENIDKYLNNSISEHNKEIPKSSVSALCYQTINLSNMVIVWKSDSLQNILSLVKKMFHYELVGDIHSVCCFYSGEVPAENDVIQYASLRYRVKSAVAADNFFAQLDKLWSGWRIDKRYLTAGVDDIDIPLFDIPITRVYEMYMRLLDDSLLKDNYQKAFFDSALHIGIQLDNKIGNYIAEDNQLIEQYSTLLGRLQSARKENGEFDARNPWLKTVVAQLNAMVNLSHVYVLDTFCYHMLDGVRFFCSRIEEIIRSNESMSYGQLSGVQKFIRGWGSLMDHAARVNGQFTQTPNFSPVMYDIPVKLLEFYTALAKWCSRYMQSDEEEQQYVFPMFVSPKLCRHTKVYDVFSDNAPSSRLLYVDLPLDMMYQCKSIAFQLCHELSHYCGEKQRNRKYRKYNYALTITHLVSSYLCFDKIACIKQIYEDIKTYFDKAEEPVASGAFNTDYMKELSKLSTDCINALLREPMYYSEWIRLQLEDEPKRDELYINLAQDISFDIATLGRAFPSCISRIAELYEECYADLSMIHILQPSTEEYLSLFLQELSRLNKADVKYEFDYMCFVQRVAMVFLATNFFAENERPKNSTLSGFFDSVIYLCKCIERGDQEISEQCFSVDLLNNITIYLKKCLETMKSRDDNPSHSVNVEDLRKMLHRIADNCELDSPEFQMFLREYEDGLTRNSGNNE